MFTRFLVLAFFLLISSSLSAQEIKKILNEGLDDGLTVDLREPLYSNGVLTTEKGGVITGPQLRIQATHLSYSHRTVEKDLIWTLEADGDLIIEFGEYHFVGEKLFYDFKAKTGTITKGKTSSEPWFFGGEELELRSDGSFIIYNGYVTTSENDQPQWGLYSKEVDVSEKRYMRAKNISLKIYNTSILWVPSLRANLKSVLDNPLRYRFRWGGRQGPRFGLTYEIYSSDVFKTFVRFDYRLTRGPGGGIETHYRSKDRKTEFQSINYLAKDSSIVHPHEKARFRFEGKFHKLLHDDRTKVKFTYDKISDRDMPSSYYDRDFDFDTAEKTQLTIRRQEERLIWHFNTCVRINSFQTIKQELPAFEVNLKPVALYSTGIIFENLINASYLDFEYSKFLPHAKNYASARFEYFPTLYRPFLLGPFATLTPEIGSYLILYGNTPKRGKEHLLVGKFGLNLQSNLYRTYFSFKHVIEPYLNYQYYSSPTSSPKQHYIFDLSDGWTRLNYLTFGCKHLLYSRQADSGFHTLFEANLYSYAFFHTNKMQTIPRVYGNFSFYFRPNLIHTLDVAWNLEKQQIDYFNIKTAWTLSEDFAVKLEYRHRGAYSWRKVDPENFFLDVFRSEKQLRHSPLSDRRDTFLVHLFYRIHPDWAVQFTSRQGFNRQREPNYLEYEIDILTTIQTAWHLRFSFQHQENDNRVAIYFNVGLKKPEPLEKPQKVSFFN